MNPEELIENFKRKGYPLTPRCAKKITQYTKKILAPKDEILEIEIDIFNRDLYLLETLEKELFLVEERMLKEVKRTNTSFLLSKIKGLSEIIVASFAEVTGKAGNYRFGKKIFSRSGVSSKVNQSGERNIKSLSIRRGESKLLRSILFKMAYSVKRHNPYFSLYYSFP